MNARMLSEEDAGSHFLLAAMHEAGHAVAGELLGIQVTLVKVSITPSGVGEMGRVEYDLESYAAADEAVAISAAAGAVAEAMARQGLVDHNSRHLNERVYIAAGVPRMSPSDLAGVDEYLDRHYYSSKADRRDLQDRFLGEAERLLADNWGAVKAVARKLAEVADGGNVAELDRVLFLAAMKAA